MRAAEIVDLFAGPGGLDVAAHWLNRSVIGIELDEDACTTRKAAGLSTIRGDVRHYGPSRFPNATVLAGGPPCQTYSVAGRGAGRRALDEVLTFVKRMAIGEDVTTELAEMKDPRTGLVLEPLRWALSASDEGRPYEAIVLEQVYTVLPVWKAMGEVLEGRGYSVKCEVLRAEEFGVPQTRRRAILIARLNGDATMPKATHHSFHKRATRPGDSSDRLPCETMGSALDRPEPYVVVSNYGTGGDPKARGRRASSQPAFTVTGKIFRNRVMTPGEKVELKRFTPAEAGQLQTFPANYPWSGEDVDQQIGNAIPPRLAVHVLAAALNLSNDALTEALTKTAVWGERPCEVEGVEPPPAAPQLQSDSGSSSTPPQAVRTAETTSAGSDVHDRAAFDAAVTANCK